MVALIGPSGSGKSTLLRHIAGLVPGDHGDISIDGHAVLRAGRLARGIRRARACTGMIFQQFNLVGRMSVLGNVAVGMLYKVPLWRSLLGWFTLSERRQAMEALHRVGMSIYASQRASTLSGGQQQRTAIARAMVQGARTILGDEPIASLDPVSSRQVMETLARLNREDRITVVVSLHQVDAAMTYCPRAIAMREGRIVFDGPSGELTPAVLCRIYGAGAAAALVAPPSDPAESTFPAVPTRASLPNLEPVLA